METIAVPVGRAVVVGSVPEAFATMVVELLAEHAKAARSPETAFSVALSGGATARECYERLAARRHEVDWSLVEVFWGDERCVPPDSEESNQLLARRALLDHVGPLRAVHPMRCDGAAQDGQDPAAGYDRLLRPVTLDLVHLGFGPDGHIASLFEGSPALQVATGEAAAGGDAPRLAMMNHDPTGRNEMARMTLTLAAIAAARHVVFTLSGASKRDAFARLLAGEDLPAARVRARDVTWLVDPAAAGG